MATTKQTATKIATVYLTAIEGQDYCGIICSPIDTDSLECDGEYIDSECLIIWNLQGRKVKVNTDDPQPLRNFMNWVRNVYVNMGMHVVVQWNG